VKIRGGLKGGGRRNRYEMDEWTRFGSRIGGRGENMRERAESEGAKYKV